MRIEKYKSDNIHIVLTVHIMNDSFVKQFVDSKTCTKNRNKHKYLEMRLTKVKNEMPQETS